MKNYTYGWLLKKRGLVEVPESEYNTIQNENKDFIEKLSDVVVTAKCGWDGVKYQVMKDGDCYDEYMVLCVDGHDERWIPISGNSKGCNIQALGENLW